MDSKGVPLNSPVPESLYPTLAVTLLSLGLGATGMFFVYEVTKTRYSRKLTEELALGGASAVLLGWGLLFLLLWTGVYV